jgi:2-methylisocitrate lyase-like PEP mutase family enzyme
MAESQQLLGSQSSYGDRLRDRLSVDKLLPTIGIYDVFSASIAAQHFEAVFCSGYGFAASHYGLPDEGYITWTDMVDYVGRVRHVLPDTHIIVDIDDGYGDPNIAANVVARLERTGASGLILEDQRRPKKCGHLPGKEILPLEEYLERLNRVLETRDKLFVVARTDAEEFEEGLRRAEAFVKAGADAVMVEGLTKLENVSAVKKVIGNDIPLMVNLIQGGKTPDVSLTELHSLGADIVIYSTPCLYPAQQAIEDEMKRLLQSDGRLENDVEKVDLTRNRKIMELNAAIGHGQSHHETL